MRDSLLFLCLLVYSASLLAQSKSYFPPVGAWQHKRAAEAGFDSIKLAAVFSFAQEHETKQTRNMEIAQATTFGKEPYGEGIGPFSDRGEPTYGYKNFFLNRDKKKYLPGAPSTSFVHVCNGTNIIYVDPEHDIVMVVRWIDNNAVDGIVRKLLEALK